MVPGPLKDQSKTSPKLVKTAKKNQFVLHFIDVFTSKVCHMASKYYVYTIVIIYKS